MGSAAMPERCYMRTFQIKDVLSLPGTTHDISSIGLHEDVSMYTVTHILQGIGVPDGGETMGNDKCSPFCLLIFRVAQGPGLSCR
jgi:hypothetical protein